MANKKENNYAFIDSQNLNLAIRGQGWVLDFGRFRRYIKDRFNVEQAFIFIGYIYGNQSLYTSLQKLGYIVVFKPTLTYEKDDKIYTKGNVDADLVLHTMIEYRSYDKAIIVSGDGDFYCLVDYLKEQDKLKRLIVPNKYKYSALLRKFTGFITFLNGTRDKLGRKTKRAA